MRSPLVVLSLVMATASLGVVTSTVAAQTAQSRDCSDKASAQNLHGADRKAFRARCLKGALSPKTPTAPTGPGKEARAITAPSGADRTVRSKQCSTEADKRGLTSKDREAFRLSCLATAGPVTEGETHAHAPTPAKSIPGIGVNNPH